MLDNIYSRTRYFAGNIYRYVTSPFIQYSIDPVDATTIFACSFGDDGWHHIRQTLREYDVNPSLKPHESTLGLFLKNFQPISISNFASIPTESPLPLFVYPWGTFNTRSSSSNKDPATSRFCGPSSQDFINQEFTKTISLYLHIRANGYRPSTYPHSHIGGTWLIANDGRRRFVVMQGNHRMAILAHLNYRNITVRSIPQAIRVVRESCLYKLPLVSNKTCSIAHAKSVFDLFFTNHGDHINQLISYSLE